MDNNNNPKVAELEELKKSINTLKGKLTTLENNKKKIEDEANELIASTIYQKKQELERSYDEIIKEAEQRVKVAEKEKSNEKKKNIDKLVEHNTRSLRESNVYLNNEIKRLLKENRLPGFINSSVYMSIWNPTTLFEKLGRMLAIVIVLAIPSIICFGTYSAQLKAIFPLDIIRFIIILFIYCIFIFIAGLIWLAIEKLTKKNPEILKEVKELRKNISDNKNEIKKITKETSEEDSDHKFDYTKLDREIEAGRIEVENYRTKRKNALENFISTTQDEIERKVGEEAKKNMSAIDVEIENVKSEIQDLQKKHDELKIKIAEG